MKKLTAILLAVIMLFSLGATALAVNVNISPVMSYNLVEAYRIIDITLVTPSSGDPYYTYAFNTTSGVDYKAVVVDAILSEFPLSGITTSTSDSQIFLFITNNPSADLTAAIASALQDYVTDSAFTFGTDYVSDAADITGNTLTLDVASGYYLILDVTNYAANDVEVEAKNPILCTVLGTALNIKLKTESYTPPVKDVFVGGISANGKSVSIGDDVDFEIDLIIPNYSEYTDYELVFTDTLGTGYTFNDDILVELDSTELEEDTDYEIDFDVAANGVTTITITFADVSDFDVGAELVITYSATVNEDAGNELTNDITVLENGSDVDGTGTKQYTYGIKVEKYNEYQLPLGGVEFMLFDKAPAFDADGNITNGAVSYSFTGNPGDYILDAAGEAEVYTGTDGVLKLWGLKVGTYYLVETKALEGYNKLADAIEIEIIQATVPENVVDVINDNSDAYYDLDVINFMGIELPTTGGIGTALFTILGLGIMMGAGVILVVNRKRVFGK